MRGAFRRWQAENEFSETGSQRAVTILSFPPVIPPEARTCLGPTSTVTTSSYTESKPRV